MINHYDYTFEHRGIPENVDIVYKCVPGRPFAQPPEYPHISIVEARCSSKAVESAFWRYWYDNPEEMEGLLEHWDESERELEGDRADAAYEAWRDGG
jgi:hypothetical protein